jgi:hypothetical protein
MNAAVLCSCAAVWSTGEGEADQPFDSEGTAGIRSRVPLCDNRSEPLICSWVAMI